MRIDVPGGHISAVIGGRSAQPLPQLRPDREVLAAFGDPGQRALLITGEHDGTRLWLGDATERQAQWLPGHAGTHVIPGCGHWVQEERPEHVNALLLDFLNARPRGGYANAAEAPAVSAGVVRRVHTRVASVRYTAVGDDVRRARWLSRLTAAAG